MLTAAAKPAASNSQPARACNPANSRSRQPARCAWANTAWASTNRFSATSASAHTHSPAKRAWVRTSSPHKPRQPAPSAASSGNSNAARRVAGRPASTSMTSISPALPSNHCGQ